MNFTKQLLYCFPVFDSMSPSILCLCWSLCRIGIFSAWSWSRRLWFVVIIHISEQQWFKNAAENMPRLTLSPLLHLPMPNALLARHPRLKICRWLNILFKEKQEKKIRLWYVGEGMSCSVKTDNLKMMKKDRLRERSLPAVFFAACHSERGVCKFIHHALHILTFVSRKALRRRQ